MRVTLTSTAAAEPLALQGDQTLKPANEPTETRGVPYFAQWDAFVEILGDPDPSDPLIDQHFAGAAKETLLSTIAQDISEGNITRRPEDPARFRPGIESIEVDGPTRAVVVECTVDGLVVVRRDSGEVVNDRVSVVRIENEFERIDGSWKVTSSQLIERLGEGASCTDVQ